jgi:histidinol-phosphate aminotransferase
MTVRFRANVEAMHAYVPGEQPPAGARLIKLNTNENPYPPSPRVVEAITAELHAGDEPGERLRLYSDPRATALIQAASHVTGVDPARILAGNGSDELLAVVTRAFVGPGDTVAYPYPTYLLYETMAEIQGARIHAVDFGADFALPRGLFGSGARLTIVANPNAPSGTLYELAELAELAASVAEQDGVLVVDEAYAEFSGQTALGLLSAHDNLIVTRTLSKSHSLAGMRVGLLFASEAILAGLSKVKDSYSLDRLAICAGVASLSHPQWTARNTACIVAGRERLVAGLRALGLEPLPSAANFVFVRMGSASRAAAVQQGLRERGLLVRYFAKRLLDDGLRITVGTGVEIDALLHAMGEVLAGAKESIPGIPSRSAPGESEGSDAERRADSPLLINRRSRSSSHRWRARSVTSWSGSHGANPRSRANRHAPSAHNSTCSPSSSTARAMSMGWRALAMAATPPKRSRVPSMTAASASTSPSRVNTEPTPALNSGSSSSTRTAAMTASSADPPRASSSRPARVAASQPARAASWSSWG